MVANGFKANGAVSADLEEGEVEDDLHENRIEAAPTLKGISEVGHAPIGPYFVD